VGELHAEREQRVTPFELFFDLVFVFAFTQVTTVLSDNPTWSGVGHALLILGGLWWAWASYAWLTNTFDAGLGAVSATMLVAMAAMFVAALAVPDAFGSHGVLFGVAFVMVTVMELTLYGLSARRDPDLLAAILRLAPSALVGAALIVAAGFVDGGLKPTLWLAALVVAYFVPLVFETHGWRVQPAHFVERHGLIVIIAIGESLIAIGLGERVSGISTGVIVAAVLGFAVSTSFWLAYFDFFTIRAERLLTDRSGAERAALARDVYTYLHFPMVAGIVLFAFAVKTTLEDVDGRLSTISALGLCGGPALYLFAFVAIRVRFSGTLRGGRLVAATALALLWPVAVGIPALVALTLVAIVWVGLHAYEVIWWRQARAQTRALRVPSS
jgi:low temperature requirement protein LtrA